MDRSVIIEMLFIKLWWVILVALIVGSLKLPIVKGYLGELLTRIGTRLFLSSEIYPALHNLTLHTPDGTTQVDHVYVSVYGVFVLETKNMNGWIFGSENEPQWTQKLFRKSFRFQNPLRQNFKHVKAIEAVLQIPLSSIHSIVTFVGDTHFKTPMPSNVTEGGGFIKYIKSFTTPIFSADEVLTMLVQLESAQLDPSYSTHREHVRHLQTRNDPDAARLCPRCGAAMVLRTAKRGTGAGSQFWGCSSYPRCKAMQKIG